MASVSVQETMSGERMQFFWIAAVLADQNSVVFWRF